MALEQVVNGKIVDLKVATTDVSTTPAYATRLEDAKKQIARAVYVEGEIEKALSEADVKKAYDEIIGKGVELDGVLVQEMIKGEREFVIGLSRDPQFGPCVMFGIGGIFTEVIKDVSFRVAPLTEMDAEEMIEEIRMKKLLDEFRGSPAVDKKELVKALVGIGDLGYRNNEIAEIDINPLIISGSKPVVVDALVVLANPN